MHILLVSISIWVHSVVSDELVLVQTVFRHGDRAPMAGSTSRESESYYFRGKEHLTNRGLQQAHQLGLSLRRRYVDNGFLDARYLPSQVVFRSSSVERCLMTASAAASAMFNLTEDGQPISVPIFTVPKKDDYLCVPRLECPFVLREMTELLGISDTSPPLHLILLELFKQESERLNYTHVIGDRLYLFEPLFLEHDAGLAVPRWFNDGARKEADHLLDLTIEFLSGTGTFHNPRWILTRSGKLLSTISRNQQKAMEHSLGSVKFFAYSTDGAQNKSLTSSSLDCTKTRLEDVRKYIDGPHFQHDATISALLDSLGLLKEGLDPQGRPDFTATIAFELWKSDWGHYVKIYYRQGSSNDEFKELISYTVSCGDAKGCPPDVMGKALDEYGTDSPENLCEAEGNTLMKGFEPLTFFFMATTAFLVIALFVGAFLHMRRQRSAEMKIEDIRA